MRSTGEVIGLDRSFGVAFAKSQLGGGTKVPRSGTVFVSVRDSRQAAHPRRDASCWPNSASRSSRPSGTQRFLEENGVHAATINKVLEGRPHIVDAIKNGEIQLVFNTTEGEQALADSRSLRRAALLHKVPYYTTLAGAVAAAQGIKAYQGGDLEVRALQDYFGGARLTTLWPNAYLRFDDGCRRGPRTGRGRRFVLLNGRDDGQDSDDARGLQGSRRGA